MKIVFVVLITMIASTLFAGQVTIETIGQADIVESDTITARGLAFDEATKKAVAKAVERFLTAKTIAANMTIIEENIFSKTGGYLIKIEVIGEGVKTGTDATYEISIKADLIFENIEHDLAALGLLSFRKNLPRILVLIQEKNIDIVHWHFQSRSTNNAENIIWNVLSIKGFKSIDQVSLLENLNPDMERSFYADKVGQALKFAAAYNADIMIVGKAISRAVQSSSPRTDSVSVQAMVTLKAYRIDNGEEIAGSSTSASTTELTQLESGEIAISNAAEMAAIDIIPGIIDNWTAEKASPTIPITLFVNGLKSIEDLVTFKHELTDRIPGIKAIDRRTFSGSAAAYDIESTVDVKNIVAELTANGLKSFNVVVRSQSEKSLELKVNLK
ncbi:MAG: hypothetical protein GY839_10180 [candidate division Zixibacteria bacterium]|nr:hypothetical protein [candidate division Zixibacteria bacterium]